MKLNELSDNIGARKKRMRVGRGVGSGKGKTCGSGVKGQKARSGVSIHGFEGGQNPLYRRLPKRGFNNSMFETKYQVINIAKIENAIANRKIDSTKVIDLEVLLACGFIKSIKEKVKLLGVGDVVSKMNFEIHAVSASAKTLVEQNNGTITII